MNLVLYERFMKRKEQKEHRGEKRSYTRPLEITLKYLLFSKNGQKFHEQRVINDCEEQKSKGAGRDITSLCWITADVPQSLV